MVSYSKWVSILFETYPEADGTEVVSVAGSTWSENKDLLSGATVAEARNLAEKV